PSNESFECHSPNTVVLGMALSLIAWDVQVQPFGIGNGTFSPGVKCSKDFTSTTTHATPPHNHTTHSPKPTTTSPAPTHPPTHPPPVPPAPPAAPSKGNYSLTQDNQTCLIAILALRLNVISSQVAHGIFNVDPNNTKATGHCDPNSPVLRLTYPQGYLTFTFVKNESKFYLHKLEGLLQHTFPNATPHEKYVGANSSLKLFQASVGNSYACMAEQYAVVNSTVNHTVRVVISQVQLQPFNVTSSKFSTAEKCSQDTDNMLIPIIVGSVLAALVLVVLVAYIIGKRRSHSGYQSI
uniref:Lysosomal associated membrane protein 1b n=1 Tax=Petromyzon marinus TaxID=7757 RepID=S4RWV1_PETMA